MFGALIFSFLKMPNANLPFFTSGWTTTMNIYSQVGLVTLVGLVSKTASSSSNLPTPSSAAA